MLVFLSGKITNVLDDYDNVRIGGLPLIKTLERFNGQQVHLCWAFDDQPISPDEFVTITVETQEGLIEASVTRGYSEVTGEYGWSDCKVGGHDIEALFTMQKDHHGALLVSTEPLDLANSFEAERVVSWFLEKS